MWGTMWCPCCECGGASWFEAGGSRRGWGALAFERRPVQFPVAIEGVRSGGGCAIAATGGEQKWGGCFGSKGSREDRCCLVSATVPFLFFWGGWVGEWGGVALACFLMWVIGLMQ